MGEVISDIDCKVSFERLCKPPRHVLDVKVFYRHELQVIDAVRRKKELCSRKPLIAYCELAEIDVVKRGSKPAREILL